MKIMNVNILLFLSTLCFVLFPEGAHALSFDGNTNVIFITIDGVRWQEFINNRPDKLLMHGDHAPIFKFLWDQKEKGNGVIVGNRHKKDRMTVSNIHNLSLPAYQSIFLGEATDCASNDCSSVSKETFLEKIKDELELDETQMGVFASWNRIGRAIEKTKGNIHSNIEFQKYIDPLYPNDEVFNWVNENQFKDVPLWHGSRFDKYTYALALRYLELHHPKFLYLSLVDSDEWGHLSDYYNYIQTLRQYDHWLEQLFERVKRIKGYGENTIIIVTTDHGRGKSRLLWPHHAAVIPSSKYVWMYLWDSNGVLSQMKKNGEIDLKKMEHNDIRPMIESFFNLN